MDGMGYTNYKVILNHKGPLKQRDPDYKGSRYNVQVEWEMGKVTWEPLNQADGKGGIWHADPVTLAIYAKKHGLLDTPGWGVPRLKKIAEMHECIVASTMQTKLQSFCMRPVYMYAFLFLHNHEQVMQFNRENGNTK